jgi:hypothetical protein
MKYMIQLLEHILDCLYGVSIAVIFYWWYVPVASAFPLAHHYSGSISPFYYLIIRPKLSISVGAQRCPLYAVVRRSPLTGSAPRHSPS